jgi:exosome complex RNA-binding protein Rrp4
MTVNEVMTKCFPAYGEADTSAEWTQIEDRYKLGEIVNGRIVARFPFGLAVDFGAPLPGILLVTKVPNLTRERYEREPEYQLGTLVSARIYVFAKEQQEIGLTQIDDSEPPAPADAR